MNDTTLVLMWTGIIILGIILGYVIEKRFRP